MSIYIYVCVYKIVQMMDVNLIQQQRLAVALVKFRQLPLTALQGKLHSSCVRNMLIVNVGPSHNPLFRLTAMQ